MPVMTIRRVFTILAFCIGVAFVVEAFVPGSGHPVHSPGGLQIEYRSYTFDRVPYFSVPALASESVEQLRCSTLAANYPNQTCTPSDVKDVIPGVAQSPDTLYVLWSSCFNYTNGSHISWQGVNLEFLRLTRTLVIHCYMGTSWFHFVPHAMGISALPPPSLLTIPTPQIGSGRIRIDEDDRFEYLVGDQNTESNLTTATIT